MEAKRWGVAVTHRRFGKSVLADNHLQRAALRCQRERPRFAYIAPTYTQGKSIVWDYMRYYAKPIPGHTVNISELRIDYPNGGQVRIFGADNPDSLRGLYFDGVVLDEYGLHPPKIFTEVVRPALADREGWALFLGTPNGKNQFYDVVQRARDNPEWFFAEFRASMTGILSKAELDAARASMTDDEYEQEFECSFDASVKGAIYAREVAAARADGRVTRVPYDPLLPVDTDWDLGVGDATAIWFSQSLRSGEVRCIDYYENTGQGLPHYKQILNQKGYAYGEHVAPHDIQVRELGTGRSRLETALSLGLNFRVGQKVDRLEDRIHAGRMLFPRVWFDAEKCKRGLETLQHYRWDYNTRINEYTYLPVHDWASHGADAFGGLAYRTYTNTKRPEARAAADLRRAQRDPDPYDARMRRPVGQGRGGY